MKIPAGLHRVFLALPIKQEYYKALYEVQCSLKQYLPEDMSWTPLRNMHITLFFFGEVTVKRLKQLIEQVPQEVFNHLKQNLNLTHISMFGHRLNPRVLYLYDENVPDELTTLAQILYNQFAGPNERPFTAHLTIARFPTRDMHQYLSNIEALMNQPISKISNITSINVNFDNITLFESIFSGRVVNYKPLAVWSEKGLENYFKKE